MKEITKVVVILCLLLTGLIGLASSVCGGIFLISYLRSASTSNVNNPAWIFWLALIAVAVGIALSYFAFKTLRREKAP